MSERTHGYVIRYVSGVDGNTYYEKVGFGNSLEIRVECIHTLAQVSKRLHELAENSTVPRSYPHREIVRVRRVEGEDQWVPLTQDEANNFRFTYGDRSMKLPFSQCDNGSPQSALLQRIPAAPRWELDEEEL